MVDLGPDQADDWIVNNCKKLDIVITADILLSGRCIKNGAYVISNKGESITLENIGEKTASRNLMFEIRASDPFHHGREKEFTQLDRTRYKNALERVIQTIKKSL